MYVANGWKTAAESGDAATPNVVGAGTFTVTAGAANPDDSEVTFDADAKFDPFQSWWGKEGQLADKAQIAVRFFEDGNAFYFEVDEKVTVWNYLDFAGGASTEVTLAGASQLVVAATATLAATLLF